VQNKTAGIIGLLTGLFIILLLFCPKINSDIIWTESDIFFVKYAILIAFINAGVAFTILGALTYSGKVTTYYSEGINDKYEKAKLDVIIFILLLPFIISFTFVIFSLLEVNMYKLIWAGFLIYQAFVVPKNIKILKSGKTEPT
jgi:hypothetical protein